MALVPHQVFGIREGPLTTIHSHTNDQSRLDSPHRARRRARSAAPLVSRGIIGARPPAWSTSASPRSAATGEGLRPV
ncbi:hypothetical protein [Crossiella equi]|uniref:hypothetical protein n=1 Tax=Crossiella equi TaxID=130796 RepID=UPI000A37C7CF|nr:hypothetical protein [Crossiella equi]